MKQEDVSPVTLLNRQNIGQSNNYNIKLKKWLQICRIKSVKIYHLSNSLLLIKKIVLLLKCATSKEWRLKLFVKKYSEFDSIVETEIYIKYIIICNICSI